MNKKLTLRIDDVLINTVKVEADSRGKSVSQMISDFIAILGAKRTKKAEFPPVTSSLIGILQEQNIDESEYKKHLLEKY